MAKATFRGANTNPQDSGPILQADPAQKILRRSEQYIQGLQKIRDAEIQYKQTWLREYNAGRDKSQARFDQNAREQQRSARAVAEQYIANLQSQQKRTQAITGRQQDITGADPKTDSWLNFVLGASETASKMYGEYREEKDNMDFDQAVVKGLMFPQTYDGLAFNKMSANADIMSMNSSAYAAALQAGGADPELVESVRSANPRQLQGLKYAQAVMAGKQAVPKFMQEVSEGKSDFIVKLNDGAGMLKEIPLSQIDQSSTDQMSTAFYQWIGNHYRQLGFQDTNAQFLQQGLTYASNAWQRQSGDIRNKEIAANNNNRIDGVRQKAYATKDPVDWSMLYYEYTTTGGNDDRTARTNLFKEIAASGMTVTEAEQLGKSLTFPDQKDPVGKRFQQEYQDQVINQIKEKTIAAASLKAKEVKAQDTEASLKLRQVFLGDMADDNDIDMSNDNLLRMKEEYTALGFTQTARLIDDFVSFSSDSINDKKVEDFVESQIAQGLPLNEQYIMAQPISREKKIELMKKVMSSNPANASDAEITAFESQYLTELKARINYNDASLRQPGSLKRAEAKATADFRVRYRNYRIGGDDAATAFSKAAADFSTELGTDAGKGPYALSGIEYNEDGSIKSLDPDTLGSFKNFGLSYTTESSTAPDAHIDEYVSKNGLQSIGTIPLAPPAVVQSVQQQIAKGKMVTVPSFYSRLSEKMPGVAPYQLFKADMEAHGMELPEGTFSIQESTDASLLDSVPDPYKKTVQQLLYYKNNTTRTDIGVMTSGQEPIYAQVTPSQQRIKSIFGSRESPNAGYDAINRGQGGDTPGGATARYGKPLTQMTLGEVKQLQATELNAVGRYQFIEGTLREAAADAGITDDMLFNEAVQDRIFFVHLDKYGAYGPWERWWIEQGGSHLALTDEEKAVIEAFREAYDPSKPWAHAKNLNPDLIGQ